MTNSTVNFMLQLANNRSDVVRAGKIEEGNFFIRAGDFDCDLTQNRGGNN